MKLWRKSNSETLTLSKDGCVHEVVYPAGTVLRPLNEITSPVHKYPFDLDSFQKRAILCIDNEQSVLVSAHTSAGKTAIAEYAVAQGLHRKLRVFYTTPIKALSNQKFKEFAGVFENVGLMTGDNTINPSASVLIMTTEILRSLLYRGTGVARDVGWVIFDEIHYLRDKQRGVVWEETIIRMPDTVGLVFLSATIPNARQFAEWIVHLHQYPCHVIYTDYRPVPLQHHVYPFTGVDTYLVVNEECQFLASNFDAAVLVGGLTSLRTSFGLLMRGRKTSTAHRLLHCATLVKSIMDQDLAPVIVFSFSRPICESHAAQISHMDFNTDKEKVMSDRIFRKAIETLSDQDAKLPQVQSLCAMLRRGVGIHHSGMLPILKEIVEILFGKGLIKVLYATETFAIGMNMPARTVLFTASRKFDGRDYRLISSGEYIQMSGRAGRRGKDERGIVILMLDDSISSAEAKGLLLGAPDRLNSAFYLTNNMVLNLLRSKKLNAEALLERSFFHFQNPLQFPSLETRIEELDSQLKSCTLPSDVDSKQLSEFVTLRNSLAAAKRDRWSMVMKAKSVIPFLQPGRVVKVHTLDGTDFGWGIVVRVNQKAESRDESETNTGIIVECLLKVLVPSPLDQFLDGADVLSPGSPIPLSVTKPALIDADCPDHESENGTPFTSSVRLLSVPLNCLVELSSICVPVSRLIDCVPDETDLLALGWTQEQYESIYRESWDGFKRIRTKLGGLLPLLDPAKDMNLKDTRLQECTQIVHRLESQLVLNPLTQRSDVDQLVDLYSRRATILHDLQVVQKELQDKQRPRHLDELRARIRLLRRLGFCSEDDVLTLKGRIACEILSDDEVLLTELMLDGLFSPLTPAQVAGVLSCFVIERQLENTPCVQLPPELQQALATIQTKARFLVRCAAECCIRCSDGVDPEVKRPLIPTAVALLANRGRVPVSEQAYVDQFSGVLMTGVCAWAQGDNFAQMCELIPKSGVDVIRSMRRLDSLLVQMFRAADVAGDMDLQMKFSKATLLIKRGVLFPDSLYLLD